MTRTEQWAGPWVNDMCATFGRMNDGGHVTEDYDGLAGKYGSPTEVEATVDGFHRIWYELDQRRTWRDTFWMGLRTQQAPTDLWVYQELIWNTRPEFIIECGVKNGGTTMFFAHVLSMVADVGGGTPGRVIGVDYELSKCRKEPREHPLVELIESDSLASDLHEQLRRVLAGKRTMVLLDDDHHADHVYQELRLFGGYVPSGCYLIVNDTNINGHPALPEWGPGPFEGVQRFLAEGAPFEVDRDCEKHRLTLNPSGFLRRR